MKANRINARRCAKKRGFDVRGQIRRAPAPYVSKMRDRDQHLLDLAEVRKVTRT
jgi:hypothetical protein